MEEESQIKLFRAIASKLCLLVIVMLAYHYSSKVLETIILKRGKDYLSHSFTVAIVGNWCL